MRTGTAAARAGTHVPPSPRLPHAKAPAKDPRPALCWRRRQGQAPPGRVLPPGVRGEAGGGRWPRAAPGWMAAAACAGACPCAPACAPRAVPGHLRMGMRTAPRPSLHLRERIQTPLTAPAAKAQGKVPATGTRPCKLPPNVPFPGDSLPTGGGKHPLQCSRTGRRGFSAGCSAGHWQRRAILEVIN